MTQSDTVVSSGAVAGGGSVSAAALPPAAMSAAKRVGDVHARSVLNQEMDRPGNPGMVICSWRTRFNSDVSPASQRCQISGPSVGSACTW